MGSRTDLRRHHLEGLLLEANPTAQQFSQSVIPSIRDKSQGMKFLAEEVRREIDIRISI